MTQCIAVRRRVDAYLFFRAGAFFAAVTQSACKPTAGASGGIFGMMGLFIADMIMNHHTLTRHASRNYWVGAQTQCSP